MGFIGKREQAHKKCSWYGFWALLLLLTPAVVAMGETLPDVVERLKPSIVGIGLSYPPRSQSPGGAKIAFSGTGFVVADGLHVVTNLHVVPTVVDEDGGQSLAVFTGRGSETRVRSARLVDSDAVHDLALLVIHGPALPAVEWGGSGEAREGQEVAFTGFPLGMVLGLQPVTHRGIISSIAPMLPPASDSGSLTASRVKALRHRFDILQLNATSYPGNSGSPVYATDSGRVIGVLSRTMVKEPGESVIERPSGISFAIPVEFAKRLVNQNIKSS